MLLANCIPLWIAASDSSEPSVGSRICLNIVTSFVVPFDRAKFFVASKKKPAHPSDKSPEWLALNSPFHFPPPKNVLRSAGLASDHAGSLFQ